MKVIMGARAKAISGTAKGGAKTVRRLAASRSSREPAEQAKSSINSAQEQARSALKEARSSLKGARKQARATVKEARREARKRTTRTRIAAARARAQARAKAGPRAKAVGAAGAAGLLTGYFLDPDTGKRRRHIARDRALAILRRGSEAARNQAEYRANQVEGKIEAAKSKAAPERPAPNDQALADRVKSEIFRPEDAPKGSVNVNVQDGVVYLRGEVQRQDQIRKLIEQARSVDGVAGVENLLHTP
jgi:osmotically-inducible protein OsmY